MSQQLHDIGKYSNNTTKIIAAAEASLASQPPDGELMEMNLAKLKQVAQEAEEVGMWGAIDIDSV